MCLVVVAGPVRTTPASGVRKRPSKATRSTCPKSRKTAVVGPQKRELAEEQCGRGVSCRSTRDLGSPVSVKRAKVDDLDTMAKEAFNKWDPDRSITVDELDLRLEIQRQKIKALELMLMKGVLKRKRSEVEGGDDEVDGAGVEAAPASVSLEAVGTSLPLAMESVVAPMSFGAMDFSMPSGFDAGLMVDLSFSPLPPLSPSFWMPVGGESTLPVPVEVVEA